MTKDEIFKQLDGIFADVFDDESIHVNEKTTAEDIDDWDSLEQINLVLAIENKFNIKFNMDEVSQMQTVGDMVNSIMEKLK